MKDLLYNAIMCPDGTLLVSRYTHDYKKHKQDDGKEYSVDGGLSYQRIGYSDDDYLNLKCTTDTPHTTLRELFEWGSYGKSGDQPLMYIKLKNINCDHLDALIVYCKENNLPKKFNKVFLDEREYRSTLC